MGLPLFHAPVESDIVPKSATKSPADPAIARSPIRRAERRRLLETRTHRLRLLHALQGGNDANVDEGNSSEREREHASSAAPRSRSRTTEPLRAPIEDVSRYDLWNDIDLIDFDGGVMARIERPENWDPLHVDGSQSAHISLPGPDQLLAGESHVRSDRPRPDGTMDLDSRLWADYRRPTSREGSGPRPSGDLSSYAARQPRLPVLQRQSSFESTTANHRQRNGRLPEIYGRFSRNANSQDSAPQSRRRFGRYVRYLDGLGDRERSPEDDSAWDTLQASITPDPQPPSVGSSFASTTVSAAASHTTASSSNTSVTNPDDVNEPPCDPVDEDAESDGDVGGNVDDGVAEPTRRRTPHNRRRSYADVAAGTVSLVDDDASDSLEWLSQMQRIVQRLAARQDIPDQWWTAVGLTRAMTSEQY